MSGPANISLASVIEWDCFRVLAYFAYFKYPLTSFEVWKWLSEPEEPWTLAQVMEVLATSTWLHERLSCQDGFYALGGSSAGVAEQLLDRHERFLDALRKYRKLTRVIKLLGRLPYIDAIFVGNSLAYHHTNAESDIDLFVVTRPNRVWTARLLVVSVLAALRQRPGEAKLDPLCCSFFADYDHLDLAALKIDEPDPYLALWLATLIPVIDRRQVSSRLRVMNRWVDLALPNTRSVLRAPHWLPASGRCLPGAILAETRARQLQETKFTGIIKALANVDTRVVVNDFVLKFHQNDRRAAIIHALEEKLCRT